MRDRGEILYHQFVSYYINNKFCLLRKEKGKKKKKQMFP